MGLKYVIDAGLSKREESSDGKTFQKDLVGKRDIKGLARLNRGVVKDLETDKRSFKMDRM